MFEIVIRLLLGIGVPLLILRCRGGRPVSLIGTVGAAYLLGLLFSAGAALLAWDDPSVGEITAYVSIALAIPLLLFSNSVRHVLRLCETTLLSFLLLVLSVFIAAAAAFFLFAREMPGGEIFSGMAVALYTGGTPNLNTVACLFRLDSDLILTANLSDILFGGLFYVFLLFGAKPLLSRFLKNGREAVPVTDEETTREDIRIPFSIRSRGVVRNGLLSLTILLLSFGAGLLLWIAGGRIEGTMTDYAVPALMIGATVGGAALSFHPKVSAVRENGLMGQYFAAVFSFSIASVMDVRSLGAVSLRIFAVYAVVTVASFCIHALLCRVFHIGANTMIVTATAGIYGPAFIPGICKAVHGEDLLASGLIAGSLGYALGTWLGAAFVLILRLFL